MMQKADFSDLLPRVLSAAVLLVVFFGALWYGGDFWAVVVICAGGLMGFEISRMHSRNAQLAVAYGLLVAAAVLCWLFISPLWAGGCAILLAGAAIRAHRPVAVVIVWTVVIGVSAVVLQHLRVNWGLPFTAWLIAVVIASDVGGYFAGKLIGGPKILPKISPKKTWAGTLGGWALALVVGFIAVRLGIGGWEMLPLSMALAIASQLGDLMESLMKRRAGVKDSSAMIPGHGGLLDRFDGVVGACVAMALVIATGGSG